MQTTLCLSSLAWGLQTLHTFSTSCNIMIVIITHNNSRHLLSAFYTSGPVVKYFPYGISFKTHKNPSGSSCCFLHFTKQGTKAQKD